MKHEYIIIGSRETKFVVTKCLGNFKKIFSIFILIVISFNLSSCTKKDKTISLKSSLERLINGNKRFSNNKEKKINNNKKRKELLTNQKPFAAILGCSDSRVTPEIIFDEGLGDLFVIRVAGNIVTPSLLESIEYSAKYLNSSIILVLVWSPSYCVVSCGGAPLDIVKKYIENQRAPTLEKHVKKSKALTRS